jgi:hypothetical protein
MKLRLYDYSKDYYLRNDSNNCMFTFTIKQFNSGNLEWLNTITIFAR